MENKEEALARLMTEHGDSLLRMCCLYLKDAALAEDAVQETFLKAYRGMDAFRGDASERTWLTRIAINVCRDMLRKPWHRFIDRFKTPEDAEGQAPPLEIADDTVSMAVMRLHQNHRKDQTAGIRISGSGADAVHGDGAGRGADILSAL